MARTFSGRRLREARSAAGVSAEQIAIGVGRSAYSVHDYERGRVLPPVDVLIKAATLIGCRLDDLLEEEVERVA